MSEPNTTFGVSKGTSGEIQWAMASMQGWRIDMEDDHIILPDFTEDLALFAIFDGHGGPEVARVAAKIYPSFLKSNEFCKKKDYQRALLSSFEKFDLFMMSPEGKKVFSASSSLNKEMELCAGCTAIVALIEKNWEMPEEWSETEVGVRAYKDLDLRQKGQKWEDYQKKISESVFNTQKKKKDKGKKWKIWLANAGDCRGLLIQNDHRVFALNEEHKPLDDRERKRIENAGGLVIKMRVDENLNLSRALGDFHYKSNFNLPFDQQLIISKPDIYELVVNTSEASYLFLGCDGVFEILSDLEISRQIFKRIISEQTKKKTESEDETSIIDEMKEVIKNEDKLENENKIEEENLENLENQENPEGESKSGESLKSSSVKDTGKEEVENLDEKKEETEKTETEEIEEEDVKELNQMVDNLKMVLLRTLAKPGQITMGMGYDNMSAICVKLNI